MTAPDYSRLRAEAERFLGQTRFLNVQKFVEAATESPDQYPETYNLVSTRSPQGIKRHINHAVLKHKPGFKQWNRPTHGTSWAVYQRVVPDAE